MYINAPIILAELWSFTGHLHVKASKKVTFQSIRDVLVVLSKVRQSKLCTVQFRECMALRRVVLFCELKDGEERERENVPNTWTKSMISSNKAIQYWPRSYSWKRGNKKRLPQLSARWKEGIKIHKPWWAIFFSSFLRTLPISPRGALSESLISTQGLTGPDSLKAQLAWEYMILILEEKVLYESMPRTFNPGTVLQ